MAALSTHYDAYDTSAMPAVFVGEYGAMGSQIGTLQHAVAEAAFMVGMERNCHAVQMASFAPLLANHDVSTNWCVVVWGALIFHAAHRAVDGRRLRDTDVPHAPRGDNLVAFDHTHWAAIPSYAVQRMFSASAAAASFEVARTGDTVSPGLYEVGVALSLRQGAAVIIRLVNYANASVSATVDFSAVLGGARGAPRRSLAEAVAAANTTAELLTGAPDATNTLDDPHAVKTRAMEVQCAAASCAATLPPWSFATVTVRLTEAGASSGSVLRMPGVV